MGLTGGRWSSSQALAYGDLGGVTSTRPSFPDRLRGAGPWFVDRPQLTVLVAAVLYLCTLGMLAVGGDLEISAPLLLCLPIALLATTFGTRGGLVGSGMAAALVAAWGLAGPGFGHSAALGWVVTLIPLVLLGLLLGDAMDRLRRAEAARIRVEEAERRHADAVQLNDTIVQSLAAAKWALESADLDSGLAIVDRALAQSNRMVSDLIRGGRLRPLWMGEPDRPSADDALD
jgi:hypothetical protein